MIFILICLTGLGIILLEEYLLGAFIGFSALNLYLVIIPLGAIILGGALGYILYLAMLKGSRIPFGRLLIGISLAIGLLAYPSVRYMEYKTTYYLVDEATNSTSFNRTFQGDPISDLGISFLEYEKQYLDYDNVTLTFRRNTSLKLPTFSFLNYLDYFLNWICMGLSCGFFFKVFAEDTIYCSSCKKFYREKLLFQFRPASYQNLMDELQDNPDDIEEYKKKYQADIGNYRDYYQLYRTYCPICKQGEIQIRHMVTESNLLVEAENDRKIISTF